MAAAAVLALITALQSPSTFALPGRRSGAGAPHERATLPIRPLTCSRCARSNPDTNFYCRTCGAALAGATAGGVSAGNGPAGPVVSAAELWASGWPVEEVNFLAVGGGLGSFVWVDHLRVFGVPARRIRVVGPYQDPYRRFEWLCTNSQIDRNDPLRSGSDGRPDNLWGWPGYGLASAWDALRRGKLGTAIGTLAGLAGEPDLATTFVPRAGQVYRGIDREAARISWDQMRLNGCARWLRKTDDGRYALAVESADMPVGSIRFILADHVHLALGYGAIRVLADLSKWRSGWGTPDGTSAQAAQPVRIGTQGTAEALVNAYEPHDRLYGTLAQEGGTVLLRGRGITASRVLERLAEIHLHNPTVRVVHLMQGRRPKRVGWRRARRRVAGHRDLQVFNWPKAAWGGEVRRILARASDAERARTYPLLGGTTTPPTPTYETTVRRGLEQGWYEIRFGTLVGLSTNGELAAQVALDEPGAPTASLAIRGVIDATGLEASPRSHPLLVDMIDRYGLAVNRGGGLDVDPATFELTGMRNRRGRVFLAGVAAAGGAYAPVDSFLGLQAAALGSLAALRRAGTRDVRRITPWDSVLGWIRWAANDAP